MPLFRRSRRGTGQDPEAQAERPPPPPDRQVFLAGYLLLLPLFLLPLCLTPLLPGLDLPFHLALADVLLREGGGDPYHALYDARLRLSPYLLHYLGLVGLGPLLGLNAAHKLLMSLCVAALPLAAARLLGTLRRSRVPALLLFPLTYSMSFFYGFAGFVLSLPLLVLLLAQVADNLDETHEDEEEEEILPAFLRDGLLVLLSCLLLLCHLEAYLFGLCAALLLVLGGTVPTLQVRTALCFVPSLAALAWWRVVTLHDGPPGPALRQAAELVVRHRIADVGPRLDGVAVAQDLLARLDAFPQHLLLSLADGLHKVAGPALGAALLLYMVLGTLAVFARGGDREPPRLRGAALLVLGAAVLFYLALPHHLGELGVTTVYPRFAVIIALLLPVLVPSWLKRLPRWALAVAALPALALSGWYGVELCRGFLRYGAEVADFHTLLDKAPPGQRALGLVFDRQSRVLGIGSALVGLPHYYPVLRGGKGSFMAQPYCGLAHMPCRVKDPALLPPDPGPFAPQRLDAERAVAYFDLFITRAAPPPADLFGSAASAVEKIGAAGDWVLYRRRPAAAGAPEGAPDPAAAPTSRLQPGDEGERGAVPARRTKRRRGKR